MLTHSLTKEHSVIWFYKVLNSIFRQYLLKAWRKPLNQVKYNVLETTLLNYFWLSLFWQISIISKEGLSRKYLMSVDFCTWLRLILKEESHRKPYLKSLFITSRLHIRTRVCHSFTVFPDIFFEQLWIYFKILFYTFPWKHITNSCLVN